MDINLLNGFSDDIDYESHYFDEHIAAVKKMLGNRTPVEFAALSTPDRHRVLRQHLVQRKRVIIDEGDEDGDLNPLIAKGVLLRQQKFMGSDEVGRRLVQEARELYYGENSFLVQVDWLCEFKSDYLGDYETKVNIAPLVRSIVIEASVRGYYSTFNDDIDPGEREGRAREVKKRLQDLFLFTNAKEVKIILCGTGSADASDLDTRQIIVAISQMVRRLIDQFGDGFTIQRRVHGSSSFPHSLRSYWDIPSSLTKERVQQGIATFKEIMQVEIEKLCGV